MDIKLSFTVEEINLILKGLAELPAKESMNLIITIQNVANQQLQKEEDNGTN